MKYLDIHAHIFPETLAPKALAYLEEYYGYRWQGSGVADDLLLSMDESAVGKSVIFSSATKPSQVRDVNDFIAAKVAGNPERLIGFGSLHPDFTGWRDELKRLRDLGLKGLKFHPDFQAFPIDSPAMLPIYEAVGDTMPMLFHMGDAVSDFSSPARLAKVLDLLPGVKVIAAHFGGYMHWNEAKKHLVGRNIWLDTSSSLPLLPPAEAASIVRSHGVGKILFASDYPAVRHRRAIDDVLSLGLSEEEKCMIFYRNAEDLFG